MSYDTDRDQNVYSKVIGRTVVRVSMDDSDVTLDFDAGPSLRMLLDSDCCSHSYFTDDAQTDVKELVGRKIAAIEERDDAETEGRDYASPGVQESTRWHFLVITTDRGHVTLDWRNDSNGYYDGTLDPSLVGE